MTPAETAAHLLTARRALDAAEVAHANAIAAEVLASVPGPWVAVPEVGATVEQADVTVGATWAPDGWTAWAGVYSDEWHRAGTAAPSPREALERLRVVLDRCRGDEGRACLAVVVRLLRGWSTAYRWHALDDGWRLTRDGHHLADVTRERDGWRPVVKGGRCTFADDMQAALAIVRALLGADVPGVGGVA